MLLAHIGGVPVEETLLALGPAALGMLGLAASRGRALLPTRARARRPRTER